MPQYDYRCQDCRQLFTIERSMNESYDPDCTHCGSSKATRIWNAFIMAGGSTDDVGQGASCDSSSSPVKKGGGCGSCSSHSCGSCH